jgi:hypothetical protein
MGCLQEEGDTIVFASTLHGCFLCALVGKGLTGIACDVVTGLHSPTCVAEPEPFFARRRSVVSDSVVSD